MRSIKEIFRSFAVMENGVHVNGTDKESNHHYGDAYQGIIDTYLNNGYPHYGRETIELMMEVGVADGSSLNAWKEIFPNATVVGMDIHPAAQWRGELHIGDQREKAGDQDHLQAEGQGVVELVRFGHLGVEVDSERDESGNFFLRTARPDLGFRRG